MTDWHLNQISSLIKWSEEPTTKNNIHIGA